MDLLRRIALQVVDTVSDMPAWTRLPLRPFIWHPERIALVSGAFLLGYFLLWRHRPGALRWPLVVGFLTWAAFAVWEWECLREKADIRIDLFLIYPFLVLTTVACLLPTLLSLAHGGHRA